MNTYAVVVTFNGRKWIEKCLTSLLNSTIPVTILVIDNGSTDGTPQIITANFKELTFIQLSSNKGFGKANNIGIKKAYEAGAECVFLFNQDVWVAPDACERVVNAHKSDPSFGVISPMHLNGEGTALDYNFSTYISPWACPSLFSDIYLNRLQETLYETKFVNAAAWLVTRKCIEIVGGFNPVFFLYGEDDNYLHRVAYHGLKVGVLPKAHIYHDREGRSSHNYDQHGGDRKNRLVYYSDPRSDSDIYRDIENYRAAALKQFAFFRLNDFRNTRQLIRELKSNSDQIIKGLQISKTRGMSFLI